METVLVVCPRRQGRSPLHRSLTCCESIRLKNPIHKKSSKKRYYVSRLKNEKIQKEYSDRLRSCLRTSACTCLNGDAENRWNTIRDAFYSIQNLKGSGNESKTNPKRCNE